MEVDMNILSFEDLYGGKICAALDRQHPRDLFDVKYLLDTEGLTERLRQSFITYLLSHHRPINEVISPNLKDISQAYENEFKGMTTVDTPLKALLKTREELISLIHESLTKNEKNFIVSFKKGSPDWNLFLIKIGDFPAVKWKLQHIQSLRENDEEMHEKLIKALEAKLSL